MIKPTIGRIVLFTPAGSTREEQKWVGIVTYVHSDTCVNLAVFDPNGHPYSRTSVRLLQDDETSSPGDQYCEWMPYQKGQAEKNEVLMLKLDYLLSRIETLEYLTSQEPGQEKLPDGIGETNPVAEEVKPDEG